ncbi:MAG: N-acetylneuraminate lyase [Anaerobiospirillum succiniciproducens]|uniref:N-acetylneuraminate lyase n=1 Tax=Anaerobiospirillum succiniciproducens TaxID=13335 RepID=UPI002355D0B0|nr:N-acetylneuraminate lyase [Anaerobiospirillum succiniciproducens]MCI6863010.1 N-acetylneuraminate lyase [Anaerobiospirillum succiniciproducens]MDO4675116.1 N-acetylneuraminate lyase [Anaerobiospirillum succiniciproducens]MDY2798718.1 N-acetylneuraminate lyase [Anaerobiospirillum succiniciproducens]
MAFKKIGGIYSALLTSFDKNGDINEKGIRQLVRHNIDVCKVDGLYVGGSTGENFLLSTAEKEKIFKIVKDEAKDQCQLIAQVGSLNIKESVELAKLATDLGYDSLSAVTPFYYKFSFNEIKDYYNTITKDVDNQMVVYFIPFLTGVNISVDQFKELFENEKITGVKFTAGDFYLLERFRKAFPDKVLFAGFDEMMLPATVLGVDGAIGSTFNLNGVRAREIFESARSGNIAKALEVQHVTNDFISDVLANGLYGTLKIGLQEAGVEAGYCRKPMGDYSDEMIARAKEIYHKYF